MNRSSPQRLQHNQYNDLSDGVLRRENTPLSELFLTELRKVGIDPSTREGQNILGDYESTLRQRIDFSSDRFYSRNGLALERIESSLITNIRKSF